VPIAADPAIHLVDRTFVDLPLRKLAEAALAAATGAGASFADFRFERLQTQSIGIRDTAVQSTNDAVTTGYAVRVIVDGTWGFAASIIPTTDEAAATARQAVAVARALAGVVAERVERADEPVYADAHWVSSYVIDPFTVDVQDKIGLLLDRSERLLASDGVAHTSAGLFQVNRR